MSLLAEFADIAATGGIGTAIGSLFGIGQKIATQWMEHKHQEKMWEHELNLLDRQNAHEVTQSKHELLITEAAAGAQVVQGSYTHDASFKNTHGWVDDVRALTRPTLTWYCVIATGFNPGVYSGFAGLMVGWWFASRLDIRKYL